MPGLIISPLYEPEGRVIETLNMRTVCFTVVAMIAFAANSLLCRMALGGEVADPASFTIVRIAAGTITLVILVGIRDRQWQLERPNLPAVGSLFLYMFFFSFAYLTLSAATGALLLFGAVQVTMFAVAIKGGERFSGLGWAGLLIAVVGLVYLIAPGVTAPDPLGAVLMAIAGIAWGAYSLVGRGAVDPLKETASNFLYVLFPGVLTALAFMDAWSMSGTGFWLACASGALASGIGYAIWYAALPSLSAGRAATVQLTVPLIAAVGGVAFLAEDISARLVVASIFTIGGVWLVLKQRQTTVR